ncbi:MAG: hypothetical protein R3B06_12590 [Kofleriaceae bacterium]
MSLLGGSCLADAARIDLPLVNGWLFMFVRRNMPGSHPWWNELFCIFDSVRLSDGDWKPHDSGGSFVFVDLSDVRLELVHLLKNAPCVLTSEFRSLRRVSLASDEKLMRIRVVLFRDPA